MTRAKALTGTSRTGTVGKIPALLGLSGYDTVLSIA